MSWHKRTAEVMRENATGQSQKLNTELSWAEREAERWRVSEMEANWKSLGKKFHFLRKCHDWLSRYQSRLQKRRRRNPTLGTLLHQPNSSGDVVNHEGCNLWILYLIWKNMSGDFCSHWRLFCLVSVILSVIVKVFTEVLVLSFGLELVDIVNHCWFENNLRLLFSLILHAEQFMVTEMMLWFQIEQRYFDFLK